jgi:hypothetical protein
MIALLPEPMMALLPEPMIALLPEPMFALLPEPMIASPASSAPAAWARPDAAHEQTATTSAAAAILDLGLFVLAVH